jgi:cytosolic carboxypeptidase protein 5
VYEDPDRDMFPTIWAAKKYMSHLKGMEWYIDIHGHANKPGCFLFGNWTQQVEQQYRMLLFAQCMCINLPLFDFGECDFAPKGMVNPTPCAVGDVQSKEGTGRVAAYRVSGSCHCYSIDD